MSLSLKKIKKKKKKTRTKIAQRACATDGGCVAVVDASHL
jgi:hypothetical protein